MAAKLLTAVIEHRPKKSSAFAHGILALDATTPTITAAFGGPDPAEPVSPPRLFVSPCMHACFTEPPCMHACMLSLITQTRDPHLVHPPLPSSLPPQHISSFIDWLIAQLKRPSHPAKSVPLAASCLSALLKERGSRQLFFRAGGVQVRLHVLACVKEGGEA